MSKLKEKDIVNYIINNWTKLFNEELFFYKKEQKIDRYWRCDIFAYRKQVFKDRVFKAPVYIEVKYNNNHRDLLYELSKGLNFLNQPTIKSVPRHLCVFIEEKSLDSVTQQFLEDKNITYYVYSLNNDDLDTFHMECIYNCFD